MTRGLKNKEANFYGISFDTRVGKHIHKWHQTYIKGFRYSLISNNGMVHSCGKTSQWTKLPVNQALHEQSILPWYAKVHLWVHVLWFSLKFLCECIGTPFRRLWHHQEVEFSNCHWCSRCRHLLWELQIKRVLYINYCRTTLQKMLNIQSTSWARPCFIVIRWLW